MHVAAEGSSVAETSYELIDEDSNEDAESFTTAPEQCSDPEDSDKLAATAEETGTVEVVVEEIPLPVLSVSIPPSTALEYNVCKESYLASLAAEEGSDESFWSHKLYRGPLDGEGKPAKVTVHYCTYKKAMERVCQLFVGEEILGFDMEWRPNVTKGSSAKDNCSLIQLASPSRIALFHISMFATKEAKELASGTFKQIMENPAVSKVGVNIRGDCTRLRVHLGIDTRGAFELSHLYKLVRYSATRADLVNKRLVALATQVKDCLGLPMFKGLDVRASDWTKKLNMQQISCESTRHTRRDYLVFGADMIVDSASDAYAGLQIFHVLDEMRKAMDPSPPRPYHLELNLPIRLAEPPTPAEKEEATADGGGEAADTGAEVAKQEQISYPALKLAMDMADTAAAETRDNEHDDTSKR